MPSFTIPAGSPVGALLKGFSYLYAPLDYPHVRRNVAGRLGAAIARIEAIDPLAGVERVSHAVQQTAELVDPELVALELARTFSDATLRPRSSHGRQTASLPSTFSIKPDAIERSDVRSRHDRAAISI